MCARPKMSKSALTKEREQMAQTSHQRAKREQRESKQRESKEHTSNVYRSLGTCGRSETSVYVSSHDGMIATCIYHTPGIPGMEGVRGSGNFEGGGDWIGLEPPSPPPPPWQAGPRPRLGPVSMSPPTTASSHFDPVASASLCANRDAR